MSGIGGPNRRALLQLTTGVATSCMLQQVIKAEDRVESRRTVRDCLWLFGVPANVNYPYLHHRSLMSPAEGAFYLSIPNIIMVQVQDKDAGVMYKGFEPPYDQYALALRPFKRVAWSIVEGGGIPAPDTPEQRTQIIEMAMSTPNIVGLYMDDFCHANRNPPATLPMAELRSIRQRVKHPSKSLDIFVTLYTNQLDLPLGKYLQLIDVVALWNHTSVDIVNLEANLAKVKRMAPASRVLLGCYFYEFGARRQVSVADMKVQCETGLHWLQEKRIEGMIYLGNSVEDQGFECVEWTREWIHKVGDMTLSP